MNSTSFFTSRLGGVNPIPYHLWRLSPVLLFRPSSAILVAVVILSQLSAGHARDPVRNTPNDSPPKVLAPVATADDSSPKVAALPVSTSNDAPARVSTQPASTSNDSPAKASAPPALITLSLQTSRPQPTAGTGLGISAEVKNISDSTVYIKSQELALVLPPEIAPAGLPAARSYAFLPTETGANSEFNYADASIALSPGDSYKAFWNSNLSGSYQSRTSMPGPFSNLYALIASEMKFLFFTPSDYKIAVVAKYNTSADFSGETYRTLVQDATISVGTPLFVILFGAALGGLLAYLILPQARRRLIRMTEDASHNLGQRLTAEVSGVLGSILLSEMTTILLSRNSESQFLFKVSINDFWSAIAVGFLANCIGAIILSKVVFQAGPEKRSQPGLAPKPSINPAPKPPASPVLELQGNSAPRPEANPALKIQSNPAPKLDASPAPALQSNSEPKPEANPAPMFQSSSEPKPEPNPARIFQSNSAPKPEANAAPSSQSAPAPKPVPHPAPSFEANSGKKRAPKLVSKPRAKRVRKSRIVRLASSGGRDAHGRWIPTQRKSKAALETIAIAIKTETAEPKSK